MPNNWQDSHKCVNNILIQDTLCMWQLGNNMKYSYPVFPLTWVTLLINILEVSAVTLNPATGYSDWNMAVPWLKQQIAGLMS